MGDFFLCEEAIETGHFFSKLDDVVDDEKSSIFQQWIGELEEIKRSFLLPVDENHMEGFFREFRELHERVSEDECGDIVHSGLFDILHGFIIGWKGIIDGGHFSSVCTKSHAKVNGRVSVRSSDFEQVLHPADMDHVLQKPGVFVGDIGDSVRETVSTEVDEELLDVHE